MDRQDLIREFHETMKFSNCLELQETHVYTEEELENIKLAVLNKNNTCTSNYSDTVEAILDSDGYVAALNFADGYTPGGMILDGAKTQEESLCRSSNLYHSLTSNKCKEMYYDYNKNNREFSSGKSSDRIIYTKNVLFFRDSELNWLDESDYKLCDIITCPAPFAGRATEDEIKNRMKNIIKVAEHNRVGVLILGCWGCGAFGNDWEYFQKLWSDVLDNVSHNCNIVMATRGKGFNEHTILEALRNEQQYYRF